MTGSLTSTASYWSSAVRTPRSVRAEGLADVAVPLCNPILRQARPGRQSNQSRLSRLMNSADWSLWPVGLVQSTTPRGLIRCLCG